MIPRTATLFLILALALAMTEPMAAQSVWDIPSCARDGCLVPNLQSTGCPTLNFKCSCSNEKFVSDSTACIPTKCSEEDTKDAKRAIRKLCKAHGVKLSR
ncbi:MAG: hypothetical protein J3Q66DRAFT_358518 [Benniella sp.]|nr:MAG: hypothetical protein J3Q66DRAFT_358518 [Benniella sp.]